MEDEKDYKVTHSFYIAGVQFHDLKTVIDVIKEGDHFVLIPDPTNKYDPNAVEIKHIDKDYDEIFLGFVPKKFSSEVAAALEIGKVLECVLVKLNKAAKPWEQAKVEIREISGYKKAGPDVGDGPDYNQGCRD